MNIFHVPTGCLYIFFAEGLFKSFVHFLIGLFVFLLLVVRVLYIFWILCPYQICYLQILSPIPWVVFSLSWLCHLMHKSFYFWWSPIYLLLSSVACAFGVIFKKLLPNPRPWGFIPMFPSKSFIVLALTFRSLIHFELIFLYGMR